MELINGASESLCRFSLQFAKHFAGIKFRINPTTQEDNFGLKKDDNVA